MRFHLRDVTQTHPGKNGKVRTEIVSRKNFKTGEKINEYKKEGERTCSIGSSRITNESTLCYMEHISPTSSPSCIGVFNTLVDSCIFY